MNASTIVADELVTEVAALTKLTPPAEAKQSTTAGRYLALAQGYAITDPETYKEAAADLATISNLEKSMDEERQTFTRPLNEVLTKFNARFMPHIKTLGEAKKLLSQKLGAFTAEQERIAREAREKAEREAAAERKRLADEAEALRRKAAAEAEAAARAERERQAAARAEQERLEREAANAKSAKARREAEERAAAQREQDALAERQAQEERDRRAAEAELQAQALETTASVVIAQPVGAAVAVTKVGGISARVTVDCEVTDKEAFVRWILTERKDLIDVIDFDGAKLRAFCKVGGLKTTAPGLHVFPKHGVSVRG